MAKASAGKGGLESAIRSRESVEHSVAPLTARRRTLTLATSGLVALSIVTAILAYGLARDPTVIRSPLIGRMAPNFSLRDEDGDVIRLSNLRGHPVIINFWASWCTGCREEHADLLAAWDRYRDRGVVLLGVLYQDSPSTAATFMRENGGDWPILQDPRGDVSLAYGVYGAPETFFIAPDGTIVDKRIGPSTFEMLSSQLSDLLAKETA